jgi:isocitrate/isopropylmalate dehydrogenase
MSTNILISHGIGPAIMDEAVKVLELASDKYRTDAAGISTILGGAAYECRLTPRR